HPGRRLLAGGRRDPLPATGRGRGIRAGGDRPSDAAGGRVGSRPASGPVRPESPSAGDHGLEDPWAALDGGLLVHLEFDRERSGPDGDWLAYLYLPNGRMLNAELIRV